MATVVAAVDESFKALNSFGIYERATIGLDVAPPSIFNSSNLSDLDLVAVVRLKQAKRFTARTGTDLGNGEGSGYANFVLRSLFGGAEFLSFDASIGTRTRASYLLNFTTPLNNSSVWKSETLAFMSSRKIPWASHEQIVRGLSTKIKSKNLEIGYEAVLRTITAVEPTASDLIKVMAGQNIKTSFFWNYTKDTRNNPLMASQGYYFRLGHEIGGLLGKERGDLPFMKGTFEAQVAKGISFGKEKNNRTWGPGDKIHLLDTSYDTDDATESAVAKMVKEQKRLNELSDDIILQYSARGGLLYSYTGKSHFMDRFFLGGPNDVRGFYLNGLGPKDGHDSLGGDVFLAQGISLLSRLPWLSPSSPLRFMIFANGGSVLSLDQSKIKNTLIEAAVTPSIAAGFGLTYKHPIARFELNLTFPLIARELEGTRKGLQFGVGLSFL